MKRVRHGNFTYRYVRPQHKRNGDGFRQAAGRLYSGRPKFLVLAAVLAAAAVAAWYLLWSPAFSVKEVIVKGASSETEQIIRSLIDKRLGSRRLLLLPQRGMFVFDRSAAIKEIGKNLFLDELKMTQKLPGQLTVEIRERSLRAVLLTEKRFWGLDESGLVLRELTAREIEALGDLPPNIGSASVPELGAEAMDVPPAEIKTGRKEPAAAAALEPVKDNANKFPLIIEAAAADRPPPEKRPGDQAFSQTTMALILQANARLPDLTGTRVRWFGVRDTAETVETTMDGDWMVYLTTLLPFDTQGSRLALVLKERIGAKKKDLEYVDLRYNERIFFRFK